VSRRAKGWLASFGLVLVVVGFGVAFGATTAGRVRFWAWRMRSRDRETRLTARTRLLEVGRPEIDGVFVELIAGEVSDRLAGVPPGERVAFLGSSTGAVAEPTLPGLAQGLVYEVEISVTRPLPPSMVVWLPKDGLDPVAEALRRGSHGRVRELVVGREMAGENGVQAPLLVGLTADDPLGFAVIDATTSRVLDAPPSMR